MAVLTIRDRGLGASTSATRADSVDNDPCRGSPARQNLGIENSRAAPCSPPSDRGIDPFAEGGLLACEVGVGGHPCTQNVPGAESRPGTFSNDYDAVGLRSG